MMYSKLMGECRADDSGKYFLGGGRAKAAENNKNGSSSNNLASG